MAWFHFQQTYNASGLLGKRRHIFVEADNEQAAWTLAAAEGVYKGRKPNQDCLKSNCCNDRWVIGPIAEDCVFDLDVIKAYCAADAPPAAYGRDDKPIGHVMRIYDDGFIDEFPPRF